MIKKSNLYSHLFVLFLFIGISFVYFSPLLKGKILEMPDISNYIGASKEIVDFRKNTGEEALWTNSMFSGMPAYQISTISHSNVAQYFFKIITLGIPRPACYLFLYLLGFYILLCSLKVDFRISVIGAIAFAFSSYFFIILEAGHMTKAHAIAYVPMVIASVLYTYRGKILLGGILTSLTVALEIYANHLQITYYLVLILVLIGIVHFYKALRKNDLFDFFKRSGVLILAALLASGTSFTNLATTLEYGKESTRGQSELTSNLDNKTAGLDKDYATSWSYGIAETFTLLIPNFYGGASQGSLTTNSETYQAIKRSPNARNLIQQLPLYWGEQPFTSGPTYVGSIVVFLFVLGLFIVKSQIRLWIVSATIISLLLAWGKNFMFLTDLFLDFFPGYNKFRAVSMILVVAEFTIPLLGFLALNKFLFSDDLEHKKRKMLKSSYYIVGSVTLFFALFPSLFFDFNGIQDPVLEKNGWPIEALRSDRSDLLSNDALRSFIFISLSFVTLWFFLKSKIKLKIVMLIIGFLVLLDMWNINKRYLNDNNFARKKKVEKPFKLSPASQFILKDKDPNFRVFNQSVSTFNDASTSYFHKSIGGYHGAKLKRYQELIENHISRGNMDVLNMLNTKYFISKSGRAQQNSSALGNAWFVEKIIIVPDADAEIEYLNKFNPLNTAIFDERFKDQLFESTDNKQSSIKLTDYKPNYLRYQSSNKDNGIAVFSEIYYDKGWNAYLNGSLTPHFRANYVLRAMNIPAGNNIIEFKFEPETYKIGERVSFISSLILTLLLIFVSFKELKK